MQANTYSCKSQINTHPVQKHLHHNQQHSLGRDSVYSDIADPNALAASDIPDAASQIPSTNLSDGLKKATFTTFIPSATNARTCSSSLL